MARASVAPSSFAGKDRASKIWMTAEADANAMAATGDYEAKLAIVKCTTRFATAMCVLIATCKVAAYIITSKDVVRTSALDSLGDLVANCMTLYTGYRMSKIDTKAYPVGQNKFQHIGCLVFSSFMFALMFGSALGNLESIIESEDDIGFAAVSRFFHTQGDASLSPEFATWSKEVTYDGGYKWENIKEGGDAWSKRIEDVADGPTPEMVNPLIKFYEASESKKEREHAEELKNDEEGGKVTKGELVSACSEYEDPVEKFTGLVQQNVFLGCCATYKLCLWLYCILYAIPKSGSQVLVALATDKRNDFICTYSAIVATTLAYVFQDSLPISEEKVDPLVSIIMCFFIMYSWQQLVVEHAVILSLESAEKEFRLEVVQDVKKAVQGSNVGVMEDDVKVYVSSEKCTAEIELLVKDKEIPFKEVEKVQKRVKNSIGSKELIEKCVITSSVAPPPTPQF
jgi:divalent metal cation (Fe/Co/Zn/Cd) transporter